MTAGLHFAKQIVGVCSGLRRGAFFALLLLTSNVGSSQTTFSWRNDQNPPNNASWLSTTPHYFWNGSAGAVPGGGEILFFDGNQGPLMTNNLTATNRFRISFGPVNAVSRTIGGTISNTFFDFGGNAPAIFNNSGVNQTIGFPIVNGNINGTNRLEFNANNGDLTIVSGISGDGGTRTIVAMGGSNVLFSGVISNGAATVNFIKEGTGVASFSGANTYTGTTLVNAGTLSLAGVGVLPTGNLISINGGTLLLSNASALAATQNINLTAGALALGAVASGSSTNVGSINISGGTTISMAAAPAACSLIVANTSGFATGNLSITGWVPTKRIIITNTAHILTPGVLGRINFAGYGVGAKLINGNELVPQLLFVTNGTAGGNFSTNTSWLNNDMPTANNGTESIFVQAGDVLTQNTNFNVLNATINGTLTMNAVNPLTISGAVEHSGVINVVAGSVINMNSGLLWNVTGGTFNGLPNGTINFNGAASVAGTIAFPNVVLSGNVNFGTAATISSGASMRITAAGSVNTNAPFYADGSTLIYDAGGTTYNRFNEWQPGTGLTQGVPFNVQVNAGTILNMDANGSGTRTCRGNLTINGSFTMGGMTQDIIVRGDLNLNATGTLTLGGQAGAAVGDLELAGNWNHATGGIFNNNARAVWFIGSAGNQTVNFSGTETFGYIIINKAAGNVVFNCSALIDGGNSGFPLIMQSGNLDLNGNTVTFNMWRSPSTVHDISVTGGGTRQIISSTGTGIFAFTHTDGTQRVSTIVSGGGTLLSFGNNVVVTIGTPGGANFGGVDFGANITTINQTLRLNIRGFVQTNAPTYATGSLLQYNSGGVYNRSQEWRTTTGAGYPFNVQVSGNTTLLPGGLTTPTDFRTIALNTAGSVTIDAGSILNMTNSGANNMTVPLNVGLDLIINGTLTASGVAGGNIIVGRNWVRNTGGVFNQNSRFVSFESANNATITAPTGIAETFSDVRINKAAPANTVTLNSPVEVTQSLGLTQGIVISRLGSAQASPTNLLTLLAGSAYTGGSFSSFVAGPIRKVGNTGFVFPTGKLVGSERHYRPLEISAPATIADHFTAEFWRENPLNRGGINPAALADGLSHISRCEYWDLVNSNSSTAVNVTLSWSNNSAGRSLCNVSDPTFPFVDNLSALVVVPFESNLWGDQAAARFGQSSNSGSVTPGAPFLGYITWNGPGNIGAYQRFTLGSTDFRWNPLPFNLLSFTGYGRGAQVILEWSVVSDNEQKEYLLERSKDGVHFTRLGTVAAKQLASASYSLVDAFPLNGLNHYRLTALDYQGRRQQSKTIQVWFGQRATGQPGIYPNPVVGDQAMLYTNGLARGMYQLRLVGADGKQLLQRTLVHDGVQAVYALPLPSGLAHGMYWISVTGSSGQLLQLKLIK